MSTYTPFYRLFTNERARETRELRALHDLIADRHRTSSYSGENAVVDFVRPIWRDIETTIFTEQTARDFGVAMCEVAAYERHIFSLPEPDFDFLNMKEGVDHNRLLRDKEYFFAHEERVSGLLKEGIKNVFGMLAYHLPQTEDPSPFTIPLVHALPPEALDQIFGFLHDERFVDANLFRKLFEKMWFNLCDVSGVNNPYEPTKKLVIPSQSDLPPEQIVERYFKHTPFHWLLLTQIPLKLGYEDRFSHMHIVGGSGAGKTQLLQHLILHDLADPDPPALIIVDSQTDLVQKISRLEIFDPTWPGSLNERFVLIDPRDIHNPPALNIFDLNKDRLKSYSEVTKEQVTAGVIQTFDYLFNGLLGADLTAKQGVFFKFVARLMLALPETLGRNATILDLVELMENPAPYKPAIEKLPLIQRNFFERDFLDPKNTTFKQTKEQIRYRLNAILENPTLARLFTQPETKLDLFTAINNRSVILVDTAKDFLKGSSAHFGRIFISLVLQAILERAAIPERDRVPAFLIVDEAAAYFDSNMDDLLTEARKYKLGCVFAHQFLGQATSALRASLSANTRIKMASGVSTEDGRSLAADMRTTPDFILNQKPLHFATFVRGVTRSAVTVPVVPGELEARACMEEGAYIEMRELNRERVCLPAPIAALQPPPPEPEPPGAKPHESMKESSFVPPRPKADWVDRPPSNLADGTAAAPEW